jgi:hypothetical protein
MISRESNLMTDELSATKHPACCAAEQLLARSPYAALRELSCEFDDGRLVLHGKVPTYYLKSIAQNLVGGIAGVAQIENQVCVCDGAEED